MKLSPFLLSGALAVAVGLPIAGCAQQAPAQSQPGAQQQGAFGHHHHGGMMHRFADLNLTDQQKQQIQTLMTQYRQAHPKGSQPDPQSRKQLHTQIMSILTPQQQARLKADREKMRGEHQQREQNEAPAASPSPAP